MRRGEAGFTLVELMVALLIFGLLSAAGVALLSFSVRAQEAADERLDALAQLRRANALLTSDLAQAAPRLSRDEAGAVRAAFAGGTGADGEPALLFVRRGWANHDGAARPSLQKVEYRLAGDRFERLAYPQVDGAESLDPVVLAGGVRALRLRYRDPQGEWRERWDPLQLSQMPRAVELIVTTADGGSIRQLFIVGAGA